VFSHHYLCLNSTTKYSDYVEFSYSRSVEYYAVSTRKLLPKFRCSVLPLSLHLPMFRSNVAPSFIESRSSKI